MNVLAKIESKVASPLTSKLDLAGYCHSHPHYVHTRARINYLAERYLSQDILTERLLDLPQQFQIPQPRPWQPINWKALDLSQIVGIAPELFLAVIVGAAEIEAPVRDYSQESWSYLQTIHPQMATFMGGQRDQDGNIVEVSVWEKEERQHAPVFRKIYQQLTGSKLQLKPNSVQGYYPTNSLKIEVYKHTVSRICTEWGAAAMYLWLMAHSTGDLQNAIAQPLQDEVNHLAKFWGFACWAFQDNFISRLQGASKQLMGLLKHHRQERSQTNELVRLHNLTYAIEVMFAFSRIMAQMYRWNQNLTIDALEQLFGQLPNYCLQL